MNPCILMFGGRSDERFVSVASAQNLVSHFEFAQLWFVSSKGQVFDVASDELENHLDPFKTTFAPSGEAFAGSIEQSLSRLNNKTVFLGFHGTEGEDGKIQALLEKGKVAFTGSSSESSHICFDKPSAKKKLATHGIAVAPEIILSLDHPQNCEEELTAFFESNRKIVVKPIANGSSIGLHIISDKDSLWAAIDDIYASRGGSFMAEKFMVGRELTIGVVERGGKLLPLPASEVLLNEGNSFDYDGKYLGRGTKEITPADLVNSDLKRVQGLAVQAHQLLNNFGYSRTDVILDSNGITYLETNTLPGLTKASFVPQQLSVAGITMREFIEEQIELAERRNAT